MALAALAAAMLSGAPLGAQALNTDQQRTALDGFDAVAYHRAASAVPGAPHITVEHGGAIYRFATEANRAAFLEAPGRYLPAYGGYCAYGVSRGYKVKVDPEAFTVVGGTLYLNYDKGVQKRWLEDPARYIAKADSVWPSIREAARR